MTPTTSETAVAVHRYLRPFLLHDMQLTGSLEICNPPPTNTDMDLVGLLRDASRSEHDGTIAPWLEKDGWILGGSISNKPHQWCFSWKKDDVNILLTPYPGAYHKCLLATSLVKRFNLTRKEDRIILSHAQMFNETIEQTLEHIKQFKWGAAFSSGNHVPDDKIILDDQQYNPF